jgi:hypothetical protein
LGYTAAPRRKLLSTRFGRLLSCLSVGSRVVRAVQVACLSAAAVSVVLAGRLAEATFFDDPLTSFAKMVDEWLLWELGGE